MGPPRAFCVAGRSTDWVRPPVVNIVSQAAQDRVRDKYYIDSIGNVFVIRDFVHLPLFDQGLKLRKSKGSRSFRDRWRHLLVLNDSGLWGRMSICAIS
jgi:hypothetical protein